MTRPLYLTISEQITEDIRKSIILGDLTEGMPLRETEISQKYNVSRGPIRDAFRELSNEGFLDMIPNVGVKVAKQPSKETLSLVIKLRKDLEFFVIDHVYDQLTSLDFIALEDLLKDYKIACEANNVHDIIDLDIQFHKYIVFKIEDLHVRDLWQSIVNRMMFKYSRFTNMLDSYSEHEHILGALKEKNKPLILELLDKNIQ